ncbi:MAG: hypothetical protein ACRDG6_12440, partial [Candidatus Limnocylindria bacterium]
MNPAKTLLTAGMIALGLSGGVAMASYVPDVGNTLAAVMSGAGTTMTGARGVHTDYMSAAATYIGITTDALRTELGTEKTLADVAVAHGKTRDGLIQALVTANQASITTLVDQKGVGALKVRSDRGVIGDQFSVAATYLGTTVDDLRTKMQAGQTLAQIAAATSGKSRDGLVAALTADAQARIAAAQAA